MDDYCSRENQQKLAPSLLEKSVQAMMRDLFHTFPPTGVCETRVENQPEQKRSYALASCKMYRNEKLPEIWLSF